MQKIQTVLPVVLPDVVIEVPVAGGAGRTKRIPIGTIKALVLAICNRIVMPRLSCRRNRIQFVAARPFRDGVDHRESTSHRDIATAPWIVVHIDHGIAIGPQVNMVSNYANTCCAMNGRISQPVDKQVLICHCTCQSAFENAECSRFIASLAPKLKTVNIHKLRICNIDSLAVLKARIQHGCLRGINTAKGHVCRRQHNRRVRITRLATSVVRTQYLCMLRCCSRRNCRHRARATIERSAVIWNRVIEASTEVSRVILSQVIAHLHASHRINWSGSNDYCIAAFDHPLHLLICNTVGPEIANVAGRAGLVDRISSTCRPHNCSVCDRLSTYCRPGWMAAGEACSTCRGCLIVA